MKNQQLWAIYTKPGKIFSEQTLLKQVNEFAEIGFNENFKKFIESNKRKIELFTSLKFDASKYSKEYLDFLNALIFALLSAEGDIDTTTIRKKYSLNQFYSRQQKTSHEYESIQDITENSTLVKNVVERLGAFKKELEAIRNQQLILKAQSLVELANADINVNEENLRLIKIDYHKLFSNYSLESLAAFDLNFDRFFCEKSISTFRSNFVERKRIMDGIMAECEGTPIAEVIKKEQVKLEQQIINFELIMSQATNLKDLKTRFQKIKAIEGIVTEKASVLLIPSDVQKLQELIEFITGEEQEIQRIKEGINDASVIHQDAMRAIDETEQFIRKKKEQAEFFLQQASKARSEVRQRKIEDHHLSVVNSKEPSKKSDKKIEEAIAVKKVRLQEAIFLIQTYRETIEKEQDRFSVKFFHKSRNQEKISYCKALEKELELQVKSLNFESNLHDIINTAHNKVTMSFTAQTIITKGGSYFGTSRMLSLQRLLDIDEAWKTKGHSRFLVFSTHSDLHGLKTSGVFGDKVHRIVENFYRGVDNSYEQYQEIKKQAFAKQDASDLLYS